MTDERSDLYSYKPAQGDLFAGQPNPNAASVRIDPDDVRRRLHKMLAQARAAQTEPPWNERETRSNQIVFPQMANWLPHEEAERLRMEFRIELERLGVPPRVSGPAIDTGGR